MRKTPALPSQAVSAYLIAKDATRAIDFYKRAFNAHERLVLSEPSGKIGHAELDIRGTVFMLADEYPDFGALGPMTIGGSPIKMHLYVDDADTAVAQAIKAGATLLRPLKNEFYGDRTGMVADPFGYSWFIASRVEEVSPQEMQKRFTEACQGQ
jgi:PhnB protein